PWWDRTPAPAPAAPASGGRTGTAAAPAPAPAAPRGAAHDNPLVHPESDVAESFELGHDALEELRAVGFTSAHLVPASGVSRGRSAVVLLRDGSAADQLLRPRVGQVIAFETNAGAPGRPATYPASIMGSVALVRQTLLDAGWARTAAVAFAAARGV